MSAIIQQESGDFHVIRISGLLKKSEMDAVQAEAAQKLGPESAVKLLVILENFQDWDRALDWGDMNFYAEHGDKIVKIAIVGDAKHKSDWMMFSGAEFRKAPVKYFTPNQLQQARQWLA
jgi:hypothetical protein